MKLSRIITTLVATLTATTALSNPICGEMLQKEALEKKYQRIAPIYNSADTGWIFGNDQLYDAYGLNSTEQQLLSDLVAEFNARGTQLVMVVAPPRPTVAGQATFDETTGRATDFNIALQAETFSSMITQFNEAGAVAPDLLNLVSSDASILENYYFKRDTHWTNYGAANSALAVAQVINPNEQPLFEVSQLDVVDTFDERGSLGDIARATCDVDPETEQTAVFDYSPLLSSGGGLLDEGSDQTGAVLVGTSFSDRYKRDQYQFADALSAALGTAVENHSVSGGGMTGPMEAFLLSGAMEDVQPELVIWEFPYTYKLRESHLRQILGSLKAIPDGTAVTASMTNNIAKLDVPTSAYPMAQIGLKMPHAMIERVQLVLSHTDGSEETIRLDRKKRMQSVALNDQWWVDLSYQTSPVTSIAIEVQGGDQINSIDVIFANPSS